MSKYRLLLSALSGVALIPGASVAAPAPRPAPSRASAPMLSLQTQKSAVETLASDAFEGRAPGTAGEEKTVAYLIDRFRALGLQPGNRGSWTQDVPLVTMAVKNQSALTLAGGAVAMTLKPGSDYVGASYRVVPHVAIKDSDMVFVGYGINAPEKGWNDYAGLDVRGKTVVILVNDPDYRTKETTGLFNGRAMTYYGRWTYKFEEAARQGAAAALIIHDTEPAAYGWNVVQSSWSGPQHQADDPANHMDQTQMNGWIQLDKARALFRGAGKDLDSLTAAARQKGFRAVPLGVKASVSFDNDISRARSKNVVARLPGAKRPDEHVLYMAHWDHLGRCTPVNGDDICNGAIDNASGTAGLLTLAEAFKKSAATDRSLLFVAVTGEESGLLGSAYYAANPVVPLERTVGGINMDALTRNGPSRNVVVVGRGKSELDGYLADALRAQGRVISDEPTPEKGFYYRSDHFSLAKQGVPMIYFEAGDDLIAGGKPAGTRAAEDYEKNHYHAPSDDVRAVLDWRGMMTDLETYYRVGRALANDTRWPNWLPGDEFRAARDKSRAGQ